MKKITHFLSTLGVLSFALLVTACGSKEGGVRCRLGEEGCSGSDPVASPVVIQQASPTPSATVESAVSCSATLDKSQTPHNEMRTLTVTARNGVGPYRISGYSNTFSSSTTLTGSYQNTGISNLVLTKVVNVLDSRGYKGMCSFNVTVLPSSRSSSGSLACTMLASNDNASVGQNIAYTAEASGGNGVYIWNNIDDGKGTNLNTAVAGANKITATAVYTAPGDYYAKATVTSNGHTTFCTKKVSIRQPILSLYGAIQAPINSTLTLLAQTSGFNYQYMPTFSAVTSDAGISATVNVINGTGNANIELKRVSVSDNTDHEFDLTVIARNSTGESARSVVRLKMISTNFSCEIQSTGNLLPNTNINVKAYSAGVNDLRIESASVSPEGTISGTSHPNEVIVRFTSVGTKTVKFKAYSPSRSAYCNSGMFLEKPLVISSQLASCSVLTIPNVSSIGQPVTVQGLLPANSGAGPFEVTVNVTGGSSIPTGPAVGLSQNILFNEAGTFPVVMKIKDNYGAEATCNTSQTVIGNLGVFVEAYNLYYDDRSFRLSPVWDLYPGYNNGFNQDYQNKISSFTVPNIDLAHTSGSTNAYHIGKSDWFALVYHGSLNLPEAGCYHFRIGSDDGAILMIDNSLLHPNEDISSTHYSGLTSYRYGYDTKCFATAGLHKFVLKYYNGPQGSYGVNFSWRTPTDQITGVDYHTIPNWNFIQAW